MKPTTASWAIRPWMSSASRYQVKSEGDPLRPAIPWNQGPTGTVEKPRGSKPKSPNMDPSRVAGAVAKGRAVEGPALAQAWAEGEAPPTGLALAAACLTERKRNDRLDFRTRTIFGQVYVVRVAPSLTKKDINHFLTHLLGGSLSLLLSQREGHVHIEGGHRGDKEGGSCELHGGGVSFRH